MNKNKIVSLIVFLFLLFSFASCRVNTSYPYMQDTRNITEAYIVSLYFDEDYDICTTTIKQIEDIDTFLQDFDDLDCYKYYGDPKGFGEHNINDPAIKLVYSNGDYELIGWNGIAKYTTSDDRLRNYRGYVVFDEISFKKFAQKHSN